MGTNFYIRGHNHDDDPDVHLGKRSAAGLYCWDCGLTLCKLGEHAIHRGRADHENQWYTACPRCGTQRHDESLDDSAMGRELGFNKSAPTAKRGVAGCSSFSWAMPSAVYQTIEAQSCPTCGGAWPDPDKIIEDEYGKTYTRDEFEKVLVECPVVYVTSVGQCFS